jgi:hypothetical protein
MGTYTIIFKEQILSLTIKLYGYLGCAIVLAYHRGASGSIPDDFIQVSY